MTDRGVRKSCAMSAVICRRKSFEWARSALSWAASCRTAALAVLTSADAAPACCSRNAAWAAAHVDEDHQWRLWGRDEEAFSRRAARFKDMRAAYQLYAALEG